MTDDRERWALILGASSGMGEATARALAAKAGYNICGIHLDFRAALPHVEEVKADLGPPGPRRLYINMNAADDEKRATALAALGERFDAARAPTAAIRTSGSSCTRSRSAASCRSSPTTPRAASTARRWR